jgi:hypothetical protein
MGTSSIWRVWADCDAANVRTAKGIEEAREKDSVETTNRAKNKRGMSAKSRANLKMWKPGESGNPNGRPKNDLAKEIAQAIFENDGAQIYQSFGKALRAGNAYVFDVLANRAFGKMKETIEVTGMETLAERLNGLKEEKRGDSSVGS